MRTTTTLALIVGAGYGIDPFATSGRWPSRMHPRRDDEGHSNGEGGQTDKGDDTGDAGADKPDTGDAGKKSDDDEPLGEGGKKALEAERARAKAAEQEVAKYKAAAEKDRLAKLGEKERAEAERDAEKTRAEKLEADLAVERAARKHGITDDKDLAVLAKVAPDDVDDVAKRLAAATKSAGRSGNDVGGSKSKGSPLDDPKKFAESLGNRKSGVTIY